MGNREGLLRYLFAFILIGALSFVWGAPGAMAGTTSSNKPMSLSDQVHHQLVMLPWYGVFDNIEYQVKGSESF